MHFLFRFFILLCVLLLIAGCGHKTEDSIVQSVQPLVKYGAPLRITSAAPQHISLGKEEVVTAGNPEEINIAARSQTADHKKFRTGVVVPVRINPGDSGYQMPELRTARERTVRPRQAEVVRAKDASYDDPNPANFTYYRVRHGLKQSTIRSLCNDSRGNIWIGTYSGGVARFDGRNFTHYGREQGLESDVIFATFEDSKGNLWFGTKGGGLVRYDGRLFTSFTTEEGLINNTVYSVCEGKDGKIWAATDEGVSSFDGSSFTNYSSVQGLPHNMIFKVYCARNGDIWIGTAGGVTRFDGKGFSGCSEVNGLCNNYVLSIHEDRNGAVWLGTINGISVLRGDSITNITSATGLGDNVIYCISEDRNGTLWFGTTKGITSYNGKRFTYLDDRDGLGNNVVFAMITDRGGNMWLGTNGGGLQKYSGNTISFITKSEGMPDNVVLSIHEDRNGRMWLGTHAGGLVCREDGKMKRYGVKQGLKDQTIYDVMEDRSGVLWLATDRNGVCRFDGRSFRYFSGEPGKGTAYALAEDGDAMWIATEGSGVYRITGDSAVQFTTAQGLVSNIVYTMLKDRRGRIWFATYEGLSCYDGKEFVNYRTEQGLINNIVYSLLEDQKGRLWAGTNGGVCMFDGERFISFTEKHGLSNNAVLSLLQDKSGSIWFGTRKGVSRMSAPQGAFQDVHFYNFGYEDGFLGLNCRRNSALQDSKGDIWWGSDLLTRFTPQGYFADTAAPVTSVTNIRIFGDNIDWMNFNPARFGEEAEGGVVRDTILASGIALRNVRFEGFSKWYNLPLSLSLPHGINNIQFTYAGIHIQSGHHLKYRYRLAGMDDDWNALTERTEVSYGNLQPGRYTFMVQSMNQSGKWSIPAAYYFEIRAAWWQTWTFRIAMLLVLGTLIWFAVTMRMREIRKINYRLERKNQQLMKINAELDRFVYSASHELRSPVTSLMGLLNLIRNEEKDAHILKKFSMMDVAVKRLDALILDIVNYSRNARLDVQPELTDFNDVIARSIAYLSFMPEHAGIDFKVDVKTDGAFYSDVKRLETLFTNIISNAVKYSNDHSASRWVRVTVQADKRSASITIADNGIGIAPKYIDRIFTMFFRATEEKSGTGMGLFICKEIVSALQGKIEVESTVNRGTAMHITIPNLLSRSQ